MSKAKKWLKRNWDTYVVIFAVVTVSVAWFLKDAIYTSSEMLQSLTQAEATVLSLFGIIVAYLMTSFDSRLDRLEQQSFEVEKAPFEDNRDMELSKFLIRRFKEVKKRKGRTAKGCLQVGSFLISSLFLSVIAFGLRDINDWEILKIVRLEVSMLDIVLFFLGVFGIFLMFNRIAKEPEEPKSEH